MCIKCHKSLSDETVIDQIKESLIDESSYDKWNPTSIHHLLITAIGCNGPVAQKLSVKLLLKYYRWKNNNKTDADGSFFGNPKAEDLLILLQDLHSHYKKNGYVKEPVCIESEYVNKLMHTLARNIR